MPENARERDLLHTKEAAALLDVHEATIRRAIADGQLRALRLTRLLVSARIAPCSETPFLAVRHACEVVERDGTWRESLAPAAFLAAPEPVPVTLRHDGARRRGAYR